MSDAPDVDGVGVTDGAGVVEGAGVGDTAAVRVGVTAGVPVGDDVTVGVTAAVRVGVAVGVGVTAAVPVGVIDGVIEIVGVTEGVTVRVGVGVGVGGTGRLGFTNATSVTGRLLGVTPMVVVTVNPVPELYIIPFITAAVGLVISSINTWLSYAAIEYSDDTANGLLIVVDCSTTNELATRLIACNVVLVVEEVGLNATISFPVTASNCIALNEVVSAVKSIASTNCRPVPAT